MQTRIAPSTAAGADTLAAASDLFTQLDADAGKAEADRRLPRSTVDALKAAHAFRMPMPAAFGGPELPIVDMLLVLEELSYADGSAGWCTMIGCDSGFYAAKLEDSVAREVFDDLDLVTAGQTSPSGKAVQEGDGWRVSGRWAFGSGCTHADRIVGGAFLHDADGERITSPDGMPDWRTFVLPVDEVTIHDTWDPMGLAGTGSHDYSVDGAWVPDEHGMRPLDPPLREGALYAIPWSFIVKGAAIPIGLARRALDELVAIAPDKLVLPEFAFLGDLDHLHDRLARSRVLIASARALIHDVVGAAWDEIERTGELQQTGRADVRLAMVHCATACRTAVAHVVDTATTAAIKRGTPIDRAHRDIVTASQHLVVNDRVYGMVGRVLMGKPAGVIMI
jgi:alkylation response protein AidB-like acyl-CoA dehydrogenase